LLDQRIGGGAAHGVEGVGLGPIQIELVGRVLRGAVGAAGEGGGGGGGEGRVPVKDQIVVVLGLGHLGQPLLVVHLGGAQIGGHVVELFLGGAGLVLLVLRLQLVAPGAGVAGRGVGASGLFAPGVQPEEVDRLCVGEDLPHRAQLLGGV